MSFTERVLSACKIVAMTAPIRLLQITDPHLLADPQGSLRGVQTRASLQRVLAHARSFVRSADAVLCTGDIVNDEPAGYRHFAELLGELGLPIYCLPGNHDRPELLKAALAQAPFQVGGHVDLGNWRIILLDSCVAGRNSGCISAAELLRLRHALVDGARYAMVCVHHHPVSVGSHWLDQLGIENAAELLALLDNAPQVRVLNWGHVHQGFDAVRGAMRLLATPSTCMQFKPLSNLFAVDDRPPAYRRLTLHPDGTIDTEIVWVEAARRARPAASPAGASAGQSRAAGAIGSVAAVGAGDEHRRQEP